jgi:DNA-binding transcriptional regulator YiaG
MTTHPNRGKKRTPNSTPTPAEVRAARDAAGLTQREAADVVYASYRAWEDWEYGKRRCHPAMLRLFRLLTGQERLPRG